MLSKVIEVRKHTLQNQLWVEALHYQSEIENYYTHYAITLHQSTALLISLSNHKQALKTRQPLWNQIISSLKLNKTAESTTTQTSAGLNSGPQAFATPSAPTSNKKTYNFSLLAAIAALLAGLFYFAKKLYK